MSSFRDFDAYFREAKNEGPKFVLFGGDYELPASIPLGAVLEVQRLQQADKEGSADVVALFDRVVGPAKWRNAPEGWSPKPGYTAIDGEYHPSALTQHLIDSGLTVEQMTELLRWSFSAYGTTNEQGGGAPLEETPAKAPAPRVARGRRRR